MQDPVSCGWLRSGESVAGALSDFLSLAHSSILAASLILLRSNRWCHRATGQPTASHQTKPNLMHLRTLNNALTVLALACNMRSGSHRGLGLAQTLSFATSKAATNAPSSQTSASVSNSVVAAVGDSVCVYKLRELSCVSAAYCSFQFRLGDTSFDRYWRFELPSGQASTTTESHKSCIMTNSRWSVVHEQMHLHSERAISPRAQAKN